MLVAVDQTRLQYWARRPVTRRSAPSPRMLAAATGAATELEEVCALLLLLGEGGRRLLEPAEIAELTAKYGSFWDL
ncbi:hypothetical protein ACIQU5_28620 [Streptomyces sp. NPDC090306]|uniref:hypothetical protein n=1 Tax=Streptomyces sp. NPDC090306 TaxID=3365961 RepID=UPI0038152FFD